jgi:hypothetical protein
MVLEGDKIDSKDTELEFIRRYHARENENDALFRLLLAKEDVNIDT